jgi:uncharacterized protein YdcH (DUF465 family)
MDIDQNVLQTLLDSNSRFRMLYEEHIIFEKQLSEYEKKPFLTPEERLDKKKMKKLKLAGKDEMERILNMATA